MLTAEQREQHHDVQRHQHEARNALVGEQVLHTLGHPGDLLMVQVRPLWERFYRVNVFTGANAGCARVANSYFVEADNNGTVVASTPKIIKQY